MALGILQGKSLMMSLMKTRNKIGFKTPHWGTPSLSSVYVNSGLPVIQKLRDLLAHTAGFTTFLEFQAESIFPDLVACLFHVYPHCQSAVCPVSRHQSFGHCRSLGLQCCKKSAWSGMMMLSSSRCHTRQVYLILRSLPTQLVRLTER